jgi:hypothetical protein
METPSYADDTLIDPEDEGCGDCYGRHEGMGASIISWLGLPALAARSANILLNTPIRLQRMNRL